MSSNPFFSGRIPQLLLDSIEAYRRQTGQSKSEILIRALAEYVGYELDEEKSAISPIQQKLDEIFSRLEALEKSMITSDNKEFQITSQPEIATDNSVITSDNKLQILNTNDVAALLGKGCSVSSLFRWKRENMLPIIINGHKIESEGKGMWKLTKVDNI